MKWKVFNKQNQMTVNQWRLLLTMTVITNTT